MVRCVCVWQRLTLTLLQELNTLLYHRVHRHHHVFGHILQQREKTALGVKPRVRPQLHAEDGVK